MADCDVPAADPVDASVAVPLDGEGECEPDNGVPVAGIWTGGVGTGGVDGVVTGGVVICGVVICGVVICGVVICGVVICGVVIGPAVIEGTVAVGTVTVGTDTVGTDPSRERGRGGRARRRRREEQCPTHGENDERRTAHASTVGPTLPPNLPTNEGLDIAHPTGHQSSSPAGKPDHEVTTSPGRPQPACDVTAARSNGCPSRPSRDGETRT